MNASTPSSSNSMGGPITGSFSGAFEATDMAAEAIPIPSDKISTISVEHLFTEILDVTYKNKVLIYDSAKEVYTKFDLSTNCTFDELPEDQIQLAVEELGERLRVAHPSCQRCEPWLARFLLWRRHEKMTATEPIPKPALNNMTADHIFADILDRPVFVDRYPINKVVRDVYKDLNLNPRLSFGQQPSDQVKIAVEKLEDGLARYPPCPRCRPWLAQFLLTRQHKSRGRKKARPRS